MACRVGEHIERLFGFIGAVEEHAGPEFLGSPAVPFQLVDRGHAEI